MAISPLFNQLFARSPIAPMQEHMKIACQAATEMTGYMNAVIDGDWDSALILGEHIVKLEDDPERIRAQDPVNRQLFQNCQSAHC